MTQTKSSKPSAVPSKIIDRIKKCLRLGDQAQLKEEEANRCTAIMVVKNQNLSYVIRGNRNPGRAILMPLGYRMTVKVVKPVEIAPSEKRVTRRRCNFSLQAKCKHPRRKAVPVEGRGWVCGVCEYHLTGD